MELIPGKVSIKIYNRNFTKSTHKYLVKQASVKEVENNYQVILNDLNADKLRILNQVHGIEIQDGNIDWEIDSEPEADGLIATKSNIVLGIQTADCVPVLIASNDGKVIGAAHCGWKSAIKGILANLKTKMREQSDASLVAVIAPSIQQFSYEVDEIYYQNFINNTVSNDQFFIKKADGKFLFDLPAYIKNQLSELNITLIKHFDEDTYSNPEIYPSFRYACHHGFKYMGSILSTIQINS